MASEFSSEVSEPLPANVPGDDDPLTNSADEVAAGRIVPRPRSGRQELLEGRVNHAIWSTPVGAAAPSAPSPPRA